ncbi:hypothetical protein EZV62_018615 [Acer yangbiense]|uniref:Uncharacterized protein n=1 Tax=Acer yangbiense TaxID=1000413 RepID=A0A5C7HLU4_9ROSI|nr:hypothetical protein EZV62_018615 [Acer yangbiense]
MEILAMGSPSRFSNLHHPLEIPRQDLYRYMESLMRAVEDGAAGGEYFPLRNVDEHEHENDIGSGDDARLKQLGYKRELSRSLSCVFFSMHLYIIFCF